MSPPRPCLGGSSPARESISVSKEGSRVLGISDDRLESVSFGTEASGLPLDPEAFD